MTARFVDNARVSPERRCVAFAKARERETLFAFAARALKVDERAAILKLI
jgi:hypothetical protein